MGLLLTFGSGLFFLLGLVLTKAFHNSTVNYLSNGLAFVILIYLIFLDILPEIFQNFTYKYLIYIILGIVIIKLIDLFIPHHHHEHHELHDNKKDYNHHLNHISIITILVLFVHNIIECIALYNVTQNSLKQGILMGIAIGLHNLPLGFQIGNQLQENKYFLLSLLSLSGFLGGIIASMIGQISIEMELIILSFTIGMLIYLTFGELFPEVCKGRKNKNTWYGIALGCIIIVILTIL